MFDSTCLFNMQLIIYYNRSYIIIKHDLQVGTYVYATLSAIQGTYYELVRLLLFVVDTKTIHNTK